MCDVDDRDGSRLLSMRRRTAVSPEVHREIQNDADLAAQVIAAELRTLRAQISPHFLYNALNAVAGVIPDDPLRARDLLLDFADFTRYTLRADAEQVPLAKELTAVEHYIELERARYGGRLSIQLQIAPETLSTPIPHLSLQPLVENSVKHGMGSEHGQIHLSIDAYDDGTHIVVAVEDEGPGAHPGHIEQILAGTAQGSHLGLRNVDLRLRHIYGGPNGLRCETAPGAGMRVWFRVPKFSTERYV